MEHIAQEMLATFVRQGLSSEEAASVQEHLDECVACSESAGLFRDVVHIVTKDAAYEPPNGIVRTVKAYFQAEQQRAQRPKAAFELLFDSLAQPMIAGARASVASARQLLYRVGTVYVDMRVDSELNSERAALV
jgi:predicted anti-sigma-YlaC factor YlaD